MNLTRGPWTATKTMFGYCVTRRYETPDRSPGFEHEYVVNVPNEANAFLIAAAPDLLEALERMSRLRDTGDDWTLARYQAQYPDSLGRRFMAEIQVVEAQAAAAIAKARGTAVEA